MSDDCVRGITAATLSAWRSHFLSAAEQDAITVHIAGCAACQRTIARFDRIAQALRTPPQLPPQSAVWRGVHAAITSPRGIMTNSQKTLVLSGLGAAAIVVLLFAIIFVQIHPKSGSSITRIATATIPTNTLVPSATITQGWVTVPELNYAKNMTFSASDPLTGYACGNIGSSATTPLEVSATHDGGKTWQGPSTTAILGADCLIYVNPTNAQDVVILSYSCGQLRWCIAAIPFCGWRPNMD